MLNLMKSLLLGILYSFIFIMLMLIALAKGTDLKVIFCIVFIILLVASIINFRRRKQNGS